MQKKSFIAQRRMQLLIDQTNKREIADWLLQKSLPIILCNSIISIIEVHPASSGSHSVSPPWCFIQYCEEEAEIRWQLPNSQFRNEVWILNHKSLLFLTTLRPVATPPSLIIAKCFNDCSPQVPSVRELQLCSSKSD